MPSGLDTLLSGTQTNTTTLPSWMDTAQQKIVSDAATGASNIPKLADTTAGVAINNLSGAANPFTQAQGTLSSIASGAVNPFTTSASGVTTPNTNTALGSLFNAQNQQLHTLLPSYIAPSDAGAIGQGQFGSLRNQSAADTAITNAAAQLNTAQNTAALQNQQTGVNAATGLGNVGAQGTTAELDVGKAQQTAPLTSVADYANIVNSLNVPTSTTASQTPSLASGLSSVGNIISGIGNLLPPGTVTNLLNSLGLNNTSGSGTLADSGSVLAGSGAYDPATGLPTTPPPSPADTSGSTAISGASSIPPTDYTDPNSIAGLTGLDLSQPVAP